MSLILAVCVFVALNLAVVLAQAVVLWVVVRWIWPEGPSFLRAAAACLVAGAGCLTVSVAAAVWSVQLEDRQLSSAQAVPSWIPSMLGQAVFLAELGLVWLAAKAVLRGPWVQAALMGLVMVVAGYAAYLPAAWLQGRLLEPVRVSSEFMAPAALGTHTQVCCKRCNLCYALNMAARTRTARHGPRREKTSSCPNCGHESRVLVTAPVSGGDRILVDKTRPPQRWEIVTYGYRSSAAPGSEATRPAPVQLVGRVVGLPGETVELVGGDIFINGRRLQKNLDTATDLWVPVHDTQFAASTPGEPTRWQAAADSHWRCRDGKWSCVAGPAAELLSYGGRLADTLGYNDRDADWSPARDASAPSVGDVRLECAVEQFSGTGSLGFEWEHGGHRVTITISHSGDVQLFTGAQPPGPSAKDGLARGNLAGGLYDGERLAFVYRDGRAYLLQQGAVVVSLEVAPREAEAARSRLVRLAGEPNRLAISAHRCKVGFSRIALWRDVYYRGVDELPGPSSATGWGSVGQPAVLKAESWFLLGDNGLRSKDSRQLGPIESSALSGVARWIYWPPSRWRQFR